MSVKNSYSTGVLIALLSITVTFLLLLLLRETVIDPSIGLTVHDIILFSIIPAILYMRHLFVRKQRTKTASAVLVVIVLVGLFSFLFTKQIDGFVNQLLQ